MTREKKGHYFTIESHFHFQLLGIFPWKVIVCMVLLITNIVSKIYQIIWWLSYEWLSQIMT